MAKASPIITSLNGGEFSPLLAGRVDLKYYPNGCRRIRNYILTKQGPARRRPGTRYVAEVKSSANRTWLAKFEFNVEQAYVLEFGDQYIRFYSNHGQLAGPYEVATPYTAADLTDSQGMFRLRFVQSGDVLYICHADYAPRKLERTGASSFTLSTFEPEGGPFEDTDPTETRTVWCSASTGTGAKLYASSGIFSSTHVGSLFYLEQRKVDAIKMWESGKSITAGDVRRSDGKNYTALNTTTTGTVKPTHTSGSIYDGSAGVQWEFNDPGYGWVKITAIDATPAATNITNCANNGSGLVRVTSAGHGRTTGESVTVAGVTGTTEANGTWVVTVVDPNNIDLQGSVYANAYVAGGTVQRVAGSVATVDVLSRVPDGAKSASNPTTRWAFGSWNDEFGWPDNVTFFRERLCFSRGQNVWLSVAGDFENFKKKDDSGTVTAEQAITADVTSDRANRIEWLAPSDVALLIGTAGDESAISETSGTQAFGPGNSRTRKQTDYGSRRVPPARVGDAVLFAQKSGRKIRAMSYDGVREKFTANDLTVLAEHVTKGGIIDMAYQQEPDSNLWAVRSDGMLVGLTVDFEQEVKGWHPHRIGGYSDASNLTFAVVESVVCIPSPDGDRDELWMIVRRYINGGTKRYVEWMEYHHERNDDQQDAFYVDCGLTLDNTKAAILTPGAGATTKGTTGVNFGAPGMFVVGDVGKRIHYRYSTVDVAGNYTWHTACAEITAYVNADNVTCRIVNAWPSLTPIAADGWRMTVTTISGLSHLEGQTVAVWADGGSHPDRTVTGGTITLNEPASKVQVGLPCPAILQPLPIEAGAADGTAQGKTQRVSRAVIRFDETASDVLYGRDEQGIIGDSEKLDRLTVRSGALNMGEPPPLFTGDRTVAWPAGYSSDGKPMTMTIIADKAGPCTIVSIMPQLTVQDSK